MLSLLGVCLSQGKHKTNCYYLCMFSLFQAELALKDGLLYCGKLLKNSI